jgi:hypothetical protein
MSWAVHVTRMEYNKKIRTEFWWGSVKEIGDFGNVRLDGKVM